MSAVARATRERRHDTLARLANDVDCWVATASAEGVPYLVPLSFLWDGEAFLISTPEASVTSRNMCASGRARLGIGPTRDLVLIEGTAHPLEPGDLSPAEGDAFAEKTGFDPRELETPYRYFRIRPVRIQAWREANELDGRDLMRDGLWVG